jgi:hypothetical protein
MFTSLTTRASGYLNVSSLENSTKLLLELSNKAPEQIDFYVLNNRDQKFFKTNISGTSEFSEVIDLSELENGRYTLVTQLANQKYNQVIKVKNNMIEEIDSYYSFEPVYKLENNSLYVHHIDDRSEIVQVRIENQFGEQFEEEFFFEDVFSKAFKLDYLTEGYYTLNLSTERDSFTFEFEVSR